MLHAPRASQELKTIREAFEAQGAKVTGGPDNFDTKCPCHEDTKASLSIGDGDRGVWMKCHAGCDQAEMFEAVVEFTGLSKSDFFYNKKKKATGPVPTVAELAYAKKLPVELFVSVGIKDSSEGILITYWDGSDSPRKRRRFALKAGDGSNWIPATTTEKTITAYGAWRVADYRAGGTVYFVEGETDSLTGWYYGLPVLGFPGKVTARRILETYPHLVQDITNVFVIEEPDDFEDRGFLEGVRQGLSDIHWKGQVFPMRLPEKDLSDLHVARGPDGFRAAFLAAWESAVDAPNWPDPSPVPPTATRVCAIITATNFSEVFKPRDVHRRDRHLGSAKIRADLEALEKANIVRRLAPPKVVGRPVERFRTNPKVKQ